MAGRSSGSRNRREGFRRNTVIPPEEPIALGTPKADISANLRYPDAAISLPSGDHTVTPL